MATFVVTLTDSQHDLLMKTLKQISSSDLDEKEILSSKTTVATLREYLERKNVQYPKNALKTQLRDLALAHVKQSSQDTTAKRYDLVQLIKSGMVPKLTLASKTNIISSIFKKINSKHENVGGSTIKLGTTAISLVLGIDKGFAIYLSQVLDDKTILEWEKNPFDDKILYEVSVEAVHYHYDDY